jgi:hypothetical protein
MAGRIWKSRSIGGDGGDANLPRLPRCTFLATESDIPKLANFPSIKDFPDYKRNMNRKLRFLECFCGFW